MPHLKVMIGSWLLDVKRCIATILLSQDHFFELSGFPIFSWIMDHPLQCILVCVQLELVMMSFGM